MEERDVAPQTTAATNLTIYIGDSGKHGRKPLHLAIIELLHYEGIPGATVLHGIECYDSRKQMHTTRILDLSGDLPRVIEVLGEGLVTTEEAWGVLSRPPLRP